MEAFASQLLTAAVILATAVLLVAMGEVVSQTAGVINIGLEGMMLVGACSGSLAAHLSGSLLVGFVAAAAGGLFIALLQGLTCFRFRARQVVSGVVLNIFALGVTSFAHETLGPDLFRTVRTVEALAIPWIANLPVLGRAFFDQTLSGYFAFILVPCVWWILNRTSLGLALKAAGERPEAAEALGVRVMQVRWAALLTCGILAGIGGGQLTLAGLGFFTPNITSGRGFIALATVVFGRGNPFTTAAAVLLYSGTDAFQIRAHALGIHAPYQLLVALPYLTTLVALVALRGRSRAPAALGTNYVTA